ncbi:MULTISPECIES: alpha/beta hydrolase [unclassified Fusibacter]|uniref:alpha/beta hydrolase n=1 Tax=unclassified Fusibacter TaxID=2624464 RepID=UPI0010115C0F|nr:MULTISPECIES: alpha/beta hydrolase-fold protein [unclassified Fusibacter]MCK8058493.1 alpha/beta hydrolase-fold protein [Fusibacter sp. A2]NPE22738.1 alpha/beta hydrolase [Fusibacter sp. A1]RXV60297.1 alpha/beta hydrolase [Fusibacter sp. A1]
MKSEKLGIFTMRMPEMNRERTIRVWLPPSYDERNDVRYPVIYMHDGQNLFDKQTSAYGEIWEAHTAVKGLSRYGFDGAIIVGIDNAEGLGRLDEYSPWVSTEVERLKGLTTTDRPIGGEGEAYGKFVVNTLKVHIDATYKTLKSRTDTAVIGSSMGGFISLYLGATYPDVFGKVGAFSTAAWFAQKELVGCLKRIDLSKDTRWYIDVGTNETSNDEIDTFNQLYIDGSKEIYQVLLETGVPKENLRLITEEGGIHNEKDWARRLPGALKWLFEL